MLKNNDVKELQELLLALRKNIIFIISLKIGTLEKTKKNNNNHKIKEKKARKSSSIK